MMMVAMTLVMFTNSNLVVMCTYIKLKTSAKINLQDFQERLEIHVPPEFLL
jgi:hypothetical protein